jgi:hypothetical protein
MSLREDVARRAFVWGLAPVAMYGVLHDLVLDPMGHGSASRWHRALPGPPAVRVAGSPTLAVVGSAASCAWLDLRAGPVRLVPPGTATAGPPSMMLLDLYAEVVALLPEDPVPSGGGVVVVGPARDPVAPDDVLAVLRCPTDLCLVLVGPGRPAPAIDPAGDAASLPPRRS